MGYFNVKLKPNRGEIYWIERNSWKDNNLEIQQKERPGIIVSCNENNKKGRTYEVVYLTTNPKSDEITHCTIRSTAKVSTALCEEITTVSHDQLGICLGKCTAEEMAALDACLQISLGLETKKTLMTGQFSVTNSAGDPTTIKLPSNKEEIQYLRSELEKARALKDMIMFMYNDLLYKTLQRKEFDNTEKNL